MVRHFVQSWCREEGLGLASTECTRSPSNVTSSTVLVHKRGTERFNRGKRNRKPALFPVDPLLNLFLFLVVFQGSENISEKELEKDKSQKMDMSGMKCCLLDKKISYSYMYRNRDYLKDLYKIKPDNLL
ncbi:hypothetical protein STEG23_011856 [Scotinomys teguina]